MAEIPFEIYQGGKVVASFANEAGVRAHLVAEKALWRPFLDEIVKDGRFSNLRRPSGGALSSDDFQVVFDRLLGSLQSPRTFSEAMGRHSRAKHPCPPPSSSLEGLLILALLEENRKEEAKSVFLSFLKADSVFEDNSRPTMDLVQAGQQLLRGAIAADAIFSKKPTAKELMAARRSASSSQKDLEAEVEKAITLNATHRSNIEAQKNEFDQDIARWWKRTGRMKAVLWRRERSRQARHKDWVKDVQENVDKRMALLDERAENANSVAKLRHEEREKEFEALKDLFYTQLRLRAPTELWKEREDQHKRASKIAFIVFFGLGIISIVVGSVVPYLIGDMIAENFYNQVCAPNDPTSCTREFSIKGPLMLSGLLVAMSVALWMVRLPYRIYLSERHLALDASEKKAFAATYLSMKEGADVDPASEAIVLASLFRPTQDGIIKDDDSSVDISAAAIIARQLGRSGS